VKPEVTTNQLPAYITHLGRDKKLLKILSAAEPLMLVKRPNVFLHLCSSIMSQQLSTTVAKVIYKRFLTLYNGEEPSPSKVLDTPFDTLRAIGLSNAKTRYLRHVAEFFIEQKITDDLLDHMSNDEIMAFLTQIKGVGKWTTEMLLMFTLGREDIFAMDDLGIQQAMTRLYKLDATDKKRLKEKMVSLSAKWSPYRTYACMHLWQWKDDKPAVKPAGKLVKNPGK